MIDRFCLEILPNIDHLITTLKVPSTVMERVLLSADYSNLSRLDVFIPDTQPVIHIEGAKNSLDLKLIAMVKFTEMSNPNLFR